MSGLKNNLPRQIGRYPVIGELGRGAMGLVYLAEDPRLGRRIAIKVMSERLTRDTRNVELLEREARLLASLNHPNIATIHSLEETAGRRFLTLEFIEGETLGVRISRGALSIDDTISISRQIASALEAAHKQGIVHRDLKPANVKITPDGLLKVLDFGIAAVVAGGTGSAQSDGFTRAIAGTPGYMSPEQTLGGVLDRRTDLWALACIAYECLTGRRAFPGDTPRERLTATMSREPDWRALPEETPDRLRVLLARCLAKAAADRIDSAAEARRAFEEEIAGRSLATILKSSPPVTSTPNNLPLSLTSFVGREKEMKEVRRLLAQHRLVTLTGAGGSGKTRLALEMARRTLAEYPDGACLVELAPLGDAATVLQAVSTALGVREERGQTLMQTLTEHVKPKKLLLLLDNCEHVVDSTAQISEELLSRCPELTILATSREALAIAGESLCRVPPLVVPDDTSRSSAEDLGEVESVRLFVERAKVASPGFALTADSARWVGEICRRLDGIPLALELAAARLRAMKVEEVAGHLDQRFRLLAGGSRTSLPRHQTLEALIDWSYEHLTEAEQSLMLRLSVFAGGWTLEAAEAVCVGDGIEGWEVLDLLTRLVDKSLVEVDAERGRKTGQTRYRMLETVRQYAEIRSSKDGGQAARLRHQDFFLAVAETARLLLTGPEPERGLSRLEAEHDNLRAALDAAIRDDPQETGLALAIALGTFWDIRGYWSEGRGKCRALLARPGLPRRTARYAELLGVAGRLAFSQSDYAEAGSLHEESLAIAEELGDRRLVASSLLDRGRVAGAQGNYEQARSLFEKSLAIKRELGDKSGIAASLQNLGNLASMRGDYAQAGSLYEECLAIARELGDKGAIASSLANLGALAYFLGDYAQARSLYEESLAIARELGHKTKVAHFLHNLGNVVRYQGDYTAAGALYEEGLAIDRELGDRKAIALSLHSLGALARLRGEFARARSLFEESLAIKRELGDRRGIAHSLIGIGIVTCDEGDYARARPLFEESLSLMQELGDRKGMASSITELGIVASKEGDHGRARTLFEDSLAIEKELGDMRGIAATLGNLGDLASRQGLPQRAARLLAAAETIRQRCGICLESDDRGEHESMVSALQAKLGEAAFEREWALGQELEPDQAIVYALEKRESAGGKTDRA